MGNCAAKAGEKKLLPLPQSDLPVVIDEAWVADETTTLLIDQLQHKNEGCVKDVTGAPVLHNTEEAIKKTRTMRDDDGRKVAVLFKKYVCFSQEFNIRNGNGKTVMVANRGLGHQAAGRGYMVVSNPKDRKILYTVSSAPSRGHAVIRNHRDRPVARICSGFTNDDTTASSSNSSSSSSSSEECSKKVRHTITIAGGADILAVLAIAAALEEGREERACRLRMYEAASRSLADVSA